MAAPHHIVSTDTENFHKSPGIKVLDLFCCSGIGAEGYLSAGCSVLGIDNKKPTFYPATFLLEDFINIPSGYLKQFDFIHASPPCHSFSVTHKLSRIEKNKDADLISQVRSLIENSQVPGIIENVPQAPIAKDFFLCGSMFGLKVHRHRIFEAVNWFPLHQNLFCNHPGSTSPAHTIVGSFKGSKHLAAESLGCHASRTRWELCQGIPPAYTKFIFQTWLNSLTSAQLSQLNYFPTCLDVEQKNPMFTS